MLNCCWVHQKRLRYGTLIEFQVMVHIHPFVPSIPLTEYLFITEILCCTENSTVASATRMGWIEVDWPCGWICNQVKLVHIDEEYRPWLQFASVNIVLLQGKDVGSIFSFMFLGFRTVQLHLVPAAVSSFQGINLLSSRIECNTTRMFIQVQTCSSVIDVFAVWAFLHWTAVVVSHGPAWFSRKPTA